MFYCADCVIELSFLRTVAPDEAPRYRGTDFSESPHVVLLVRVSGLIQASRMQAKIFTAIYPDMPVYAKGSTAARTRLYQMGISAVRSFRTLFFWTIAVPSGNGTSDYAGNPKGVFESKCQVGSNFVTLKA